MKKKQEKSEELNFLKSCLLITFITTVLWIKFIFSGAVHFEFGRRLPLLLMFKLTTET